MRMFFFIISITAISTLTLVFSCNDDPDEEPEIEDPIVGTWRAAPWYCQNQTRCSVNPDMIDSYLEFDIVKQNTDSSFNIANIYWYKPSGIVTTN